MPRLVLVAAVALAASALFAFPAGAAHGIQYGVQDDAWLLGGAGTLESRLDMLQGLGVTTVRFSIRWDQVAPTKPARGLAANDPAYEWGGVGRGPARSARAWDPAGRDAVRDADVGERRPQAERRPHEPRRRSPTSRTRRRSAIRSSGRWTVWNEPNQRPVAGDAVAARSTSTRLLNPAYAAIHRANPRALVAGGVTAPRGNTGGVGPLAWVRGMKAAHAKLDAYAHNPYPTRPSIESPSTRRVRDVRRDLDGEPRPRCSPRCASDFGRKQIWLTEYGYQTNPPDRWLGVRPASRRRRTSARRRCARTRLPDVTMLIQFLVRDEPNVARFQSGLFNVRGVAKPAYVRFPAPARAGDAARVARASLWGQVRPGKGARSYRLQVRAHGSWRWLGSTQRTSSLGFLSRTVTVPARARSSAIWSPQDGGYGWPLLVRYVESRP